MKAHVFIGTTEGPVLIERVRREPRANQSVICLQRTTEMLPIHKNYDAFVRQPSGVIEREFGPFEDGAFRLDVSDRIESGESWQLGVFVAHALANRGLLAGPDEQADLVLWLTGEVHNDLTVGSVLHVATKLDTSIRKLEAWRKNNKRVLLLIPRANLIEAESSPVPEGVEINAVDDVQQALDHIFRGGTASSDTTIDPKANSETTSRGPPRLRAIHWIGASTILIAALVVAFVITDDARHSATDKQAHIIPLSAVGSDDQTSGTLPASSTREVSQAAQEEPDLPIAATNQNESQRPSANPEPPFSATIFERRAPADASCAAVQFDRVAPVLTPLILTNNRVTSSAPGLCGIEIIVSTISAGTFVRARMTTNSGRLIENGERPRDLEGAIPIKEKTNWVLDVPHRLRVPIRYSIVFLGANRPITIEDQLFREHDADAITEPQPPDPILTVLELQHEITPE